MLLSFAEFSYSRRIVKFLTVFYQCVYICRLIVLMTSDGYPFYKSVIVRRPVVCS